MADKKISQLTTLAQADVAVTADFLPIVDTGSTETKKVTPQALVQAGATGATLPVALGAVTTPSYSFTGDLNTGLWSPAADTIAASTGGSERLRVDSSGNLGIGTASPTVRFEVLTAGGAVAAGRFYSPSTTNGARLELADNNTNFNLRTIPAGGTTDLSFTRDGTSFEMLRLNYTGSVAAGRPSLATNATDGFLYVPTCAGTPTGTPTAITGMAPIVVNTTNNKLYFYSGGSWRDAGP